MLSQPYSDNIVRSSRLQMFFKISVLKKTSVAEFLFNKVTALKARNFIKKKLQHRCFPVNIAKFLRTTFFTEHLKWLFLRCTGYCFVQS